VKAIDSECLWHATPTDFWWGVDGWGSRVWGWTA